MEFHTLLWVWTTWMLDCKAVILECKAAAIYLDEFCINPSVHHFILIIFTVWFQRLQEAESRNQELSQSVTSATRPLLRQIENLQATLGAQTSAWEKLEKNLSDRLGKMVWAFTELWGCGWRYEIPEGQCEVLNTWPKCRWWIRRDEHQMLSSKGSGVGGGYANVLGQVMHWFSLKHAVT